MNKKRALVCFVFLLVVTSSIVSAVNTDLTVKANPLHSLIIRIMKSDTSAVFQSIYVTTDINGNATTNFSTSYDKVDFIIIERYDGVVTRVLEDLGPYDTNGPIYFSTVEDEPAPPVETTPEENTEEPSTEEESNTETSTEGEANTETQEPETAVDTDTETTPTNIGATSFSAVYESVKSKPLYAGIIAAIIVAAILFFVFRRKGETEPIVLTSSKDEIAEIKKESKSVAEELLEAERRIEEAVEKIERIKSKEIRRSQERVEELKRIGKDRKAKREAAKESKESEKSVPDFIMKGVEEQKEPKKD